MAPFWKKTSRDKPLPPPPPPPTTGPAASTGNLNDPPRHAVSANQEHNVGRNGGPSMSRRTPTLGTPVAEGEAAAEYFPPLEGTASSVQRFPSYHEASRPQSSGQASAARARAGSGASAPLDEMTRTISRQPSIRLRRRTSSVRSGTAQPGSLGAGSTSATSSVSDHRPRSISQPDRAHVAADASAPSRHSRRVQPAAMPRLTEEDPEVQTLSTLTNVQNSLFVPDLGKWVNRRPTFNLSEHNLERAAKLPPTPGAPTPGAPTAGPATGCMGRIGEDRDAETLAEAGVDVGRPGLQRSSTITSRLTESHYAALPHGASLHGWTEEEKWELDDHVRHMMHSRRSKFKRQMKGFGQYVRQPLGFFVTLYATLITLFGLAWVLFLIGWVYVGDKQLYVIHVIDSVLVALFAIMGDGLAPFRAIDTYHLWFVLRYARIVKKGGVRPRSRLQKNNVPESIRASVDAARAVQAASHTSEPLQPLRQVDQVAADTESQQSNPEVNDYMLRNNIVVDADDAKSGIEAYERTPLTPKQQQSLHHHQSKLAKSHSFYKPHETATHYAFPVSYLTAIVILLDCHSCLQISLGACTWGIDYRTRHKAITTVILAVSITVNITAGIVITVGDRKTRKKDVWKLMNRQELTGDAMKLVEEKRSNSTPQKVGNSPESENGTEASREASLYAADSRAASRTDSKTDSKKLVKRAYGSGRRYELD
ncbi:uncharacterized protein J7T54_003532 [Emericellopsis cladophorae]|uniref:Integral membrane protein n=1 Tax=Emericellopsis cladophorae TaxID=2686198 RepID=A0A9Q0BAJ7_9HYPO|nr:uncharacterized protein J7T54_003532 [Emericellopsis cladophorae]KAI6777801.1 hypothetical protein J7T54_003532 [Emericellopsis cladophorae]